MLNLPYVLVLGLLIHHSQEQEMVEAYTIATQCAAIAQANGFTFALRYTGQEECLTLTVFTTDTQYFVTHMKSSTYKRVRD